MQVKIRKTDEYLGIEEGEVYIASRYPYDNDKYILESRVPDGYDPCCCVYLFEVTLLKKKEEL